MWRIYKMTEKELISTHAPAGGATIGDAMGATTEFIFLLTPLREGRRHGECVEYTRWRISTHAPAGGATYSIRIH